MVEIDAIKEYFKKLQKVIELESTFTFANIYIVKKSKMDDIICCIYAKLPDSYKKMLKSKTAAGQYNSVLCYNLLTKFLSKKFFLDKSLCVINKAQIFKLINSINSTIEHDIDTIEQLFNKD